MVSPSPNRTKVFISYSHKDARFLEQLHTHLADYRRRGLVDSWDDSQIMSGSNWREEIKKAVDSAKVAVLLISSDFLASEFIAKDELPPLLAAAKAEGAIILPVILRPSTFEDSPALSRFQSINPPSEPLTKMSKFEREDLWVKVVRTIGEAVSAQDARNVAFNDLSIQNVAATQTMSEISSTSTDEQGKQLPVASYVPPFQAKQSKWKWWHTVTLFCALLGIIANEFLIPLTFRLWGWLYTLLLLVIFAMIAGHGATGSFRGVLIDGRNKISLSRLQWALWVLVILSAILTADLMNMRFGAVLSVSIPVELWILLSISTISLVIAPLILNIKKPGRAVVNNNPGSAHWTDLFMGEEIGNADKFDFVKFQMLCITIFLVLIYMAALFFLFAQQITAILSLPPLDTSYLVILGASQLAYLLSKIIPHSNDS